MEKAAELFKTALKHEVKASIFYNKAAEITEDGEARMLFLELSSMEDDHARDFIEMTKDAPFVRDFDPHEYLKYLEADMERTVSVEELQILQNGDMKSILDLSVYLEKKAYENYMNLADHLDDPETKRLCTELAEEEKGHIDTVSRMLLSLDMEEDDRPAL